MADFVPMYRQVKNFKDVDHNQQEMIRAFNHGMTKLGDGMTALAKASTESANDIKWIKRIGFSICGFFGLILIGAISSFFKQ